MYCRFLPACAPFVGIGLRQRIATDLVVSARPVLPFSSLSRPSRLTPSSPSFLPSSFSLSSLPSLAPFPPQPIASLPLIYRRALSSSAPGNSLLSASTSTPTPSQYTHHTSPPASLSPPHVACIAVKPEHTRGKGSSNSSSFKWVLVGAAALIAFVVPGTNFFMIQELKSSGPYRATMNLVMDSKELQQLLGIPIMVGDFYSVQGTRKANTLHLHIHAKGPNGSADIESHARFVNAEGALERVRVVVQPSSSNKGKVIELL
eukprot:TRINITY_DN7039_c0_g1_i1.p1 TRINITY_DN7039_c0_g1~~TRINITY_DN7039_c0_g1_i1.p1  ORF type:complete len:261 (-),score=47.47 TRINITY_DN7039_c0_g1_i1:95-877(-)